MSQEEQYRKKEETAATILTAAGSIAEVQQRKQHMPTFSTVENVTAKFYGSSTVDLADSGCSLNKSEQINKLAKEQEEVVDSGLISGSLNILSQNYLLIDNKEDNINEQQKSEEKQQEQPSQELEQQQLNDRNYLFKESGIVLDSGCIEEEEEEDYEEEEGDEETEEELEETDFEGSNINKKKNQMLLKNNIDSGLTERFCSLSLTGGDGTQIINNLNASTRRNSTVNPTTRNNIQQQEQNKQTMLNDWEEFYQQDAEGDTPLHLACLAGAEDVVMALLRIAIHPCLFNIRNYDSQTPLHMAAFAAQPKILRILLLAGADPTIRDRHGNTALHILVNCGKTQCVKSLITPIDPVEIQEVQQIYALRYVIEKIPRFNMDLEIRNYDGERCVHLAAQEGHIEILRLLVNSNADINAREGKSGRTPLHMAIENCNETLLNFLLNECEQKLNLETPTYAGLTAYQVACLLDKSQLQYLLEKSGAEILTPPESDYDDESDDEELDDSKVSLPS